LKNQNFKESDFKSTQKLVMNDDKDFEHEFSSGEKGKVDFFEVLRRSQLFYNMNHPKFVHTSLENRLNFGQRNINEIETPSIGLNFIQKFINLNDHKNKLEVTRNYMKTK
jgi:hypothetical protein